jgi:hypothetical protein
METEVRHARRERSVCHQNARGPRVRIIGGRCNRNCRISNWGNLKGACRLNNSDYRFGRWEGGKLLVRARLMSWKVLMLV